MEKRYFRGYVKSYDFEGHGFVECYINMEFNSVTYTDATPGGEWLVEFYNEGTEKWRCILDYIPFDFDAANKILCQLVEHNSIMVVDEGGFQNHRKLMEQVAQENKGTFGSNLDDEKKAYNYLLKFDSLTHFRIRNKVTDEMVMGDALLCHSTGS